MDLIVAPLLTAAPTEGLDVPVPVFDTWIYDPLHQAIADFLATPFGQGVADFINAFSPTQLLIGDGLDGTLTSPDGGAAGPWFGDGGDGGGPGAPRLSCPPHLPCLSPSLVSVRLHGDRPGLLLVNTHARATHTGLVLFWAGRAILNVS